jgi:hypothetical protein
MYTDSLSYGASFRHGAGHYLVSHILQFLLNGLMFADEHHYTSLYARSCILVCIDFGAVYVV